MFVLLKCLKDEYNTVHTTINLLEDKCNITSSEIFNSIEVLIKNNNITIDKSIKKITYNSTFYIMINDEIKDVGDLPREYILRLFPYLDTKEFNILIYILLNYKYSFDLIKFKEKTDHQHFLNNPYLKKYNDYNCTKTKISELLNIPIATVKRKLDKLIDKGIFFKANILTIPKILNRIEYVCNFVLTVEIINIIKSNSIESNILNDLLSNFEIIDDYDILYHFSKNSIELYKNCTDELLYNNLQDSFVIFKNIKNNPKTSKGEEKRDNIPAKLRLKLLNKSARWVESKQKHIPACQFCGKTALETTLHVDHIIPYSKGGETVEENLQVLCEECNEQKSNKHELIINK